MGIIVDLLQWFMNVLIKRPLLCVQMNLLVVQLKAVMSNQQIAENCTNQLLENFKNEKYTH